MKLKERIDNLKDKIGVYRKNPKLLWNWCKSKLKTLLRVLLNPRLLLCMGIGWMITNGWSYVFLALGIWLDINWMRLAGGAWLTVLWLPFTPEKIITVMIALLLMRLLFPNDERTLGWLRTKLQALKKTESKKHDENCAE